MYPTPRCAHCGSECHKTNECPPRERALRTCEVNIGGVTTVYVRKEDHDAAMSAKNEEIDALRNVIINWKDREAIPPGYTKKVPCDCDDNHSYHVMVDTPFVPVSELNTLKTLQQRVKSLERALYLVGSAIKSVSPR